MDAEGHPLPPKKRGRHNLLSEDEELIFAGKVIRRLSKPKRVSIDWSMIWIAKAFGVVIKHSSAANLLHKLKFSSHVPKLRKPPFPPAANANDGFKKLTALHDYYALHNIQPEEVLTIDWMKLSRVSTFLRTFSPVGG